MGPRAGYQEPASAPVEPGRTSPSPRDAAATSSTEPGKDQMSSSAASHARHPSLLAELALVRVCVISEEPVIRAGIRSLLTTRADNLTFVDDLRHEIDVVFYDVLGLRCC